MTPVSVKPLSYTNVRGVAYYAHKIRTKKGDWRYVMKRDADGALRKLPEGMEVSENVNGRVYIRRERARLIRGDYARLRGQTEKPRPVGEAARRHSRTRGLPILQGPNPRDGLGRSVVQFPRRSIPRDSDGLVRASRSSGRCRQPVTYRRNRPAEFFAGYNKSTTAASFQKEGSCHV